MTDIQTRSLDGHQRLAVIASFATMFMLGMTISLLGPSLPGLAERTGVPLSQAGIFFTLFSGGSVVATLGLARLMDQPIRHGLLVAGTLLMGSAQWLIASSSTRPQASVAVLLTGLAMSTAGTAPNAIIGEIFRGRAVQALNGLHLCLGVGAFIGPLLVGAALRLGGDYRWVYRASGSIVLVIAVAWILSRPPRPLHAAGRPTSMPPGALRSLSVLLLLTALYTGTEQMLGGWLFTYAHQTVFADLAISGLVTSFFWLAILGGRLIATRSLYRLRPAVLLFWGVLLGGVGVSLILVGSMLPVALWVGVAMVGLGFGPIFPTALAEGSRIVPQRAGAIASLIVASGSAGAMILPWAGGSLIPYIGIVGSIAGALVPLAAMCICVWVIHALGRAR